MATKKRSSIPLADTGIDWTRPAGEFTPSAKPDTPAEDAPQDGMMRRYVGDTAASLGRGAVQGVRMLTDVAGADNVVSGGLRSVEDFIGSLQSASAKKDQQEVARILNDAEGKGVLDQVMAGIKAFTTAPLQTMAQAAGTSIPTIGAALIPGVGPAAVAARFAAPLVAGAAQGVGGVKSSIYDEVKQRALQEGRTPAEAEQLAVSAQEYASANGGQIALGGALGAWAGKSGLEGAAHRLVYGTGGKAVPGMAARVGMGALAEGIPEAVQGGQEKYASNTAQGNAGFKTDPMSGVVANATMEGLAGHAMGGAMGVPAPADHAPVVDPGAAIRATKQPEGGPMTRAANAAIEAQAQAADAGMPALPTLSAEQEQAALASIEAQGGKDAKGLRQFAAAANSAAGARPTPTAQPGQGMLATGQSTGPSATVVDAPFSDRLLTLREQLGDEATRQALRTQFGDDALNQATYYANIADRPDVLKGVDRTRDNMLALAERMVSMALLKPINRPGVESDSTQAAQLEGPGAGPAQIGLDTTMTGRMRVDAAGNAAPETRADAINTQQAAAGMGNDERQARKASAVNADPAPAAEAKPAGTPALGYDTTPTGRMRAGSEGVAPETAADAINTRQAQGDRDAEAQRKADLGLTPDVQAVQDRNAKGRAMPGDLLNPKGEPFKHERAAITAQKKAKGGTVLQVAGGWVVRPQPSTVEPTNAQGQETAAVPPAPVAPAQQEGTDRAGAAPAEAAAAGTAGPTGRDGAGVEADGLNGGWVEGNDSPNPKFKTWTRKLPDGREVQVLQTGPRSFVATNAAGRPGSGAFGTLKEAQAAAKPGPATSPAAGEPSNAAAPVEADSGSAAPAPAAAAPASEEMPQIGSKPEKAVERRNRLKAERAAPAPAPVADTRKAEMRPYRREDGSIGYEAVPINPPAAPAPSTTNATPPATQGNADKPGPAKPEAAPGGNKLVSEDAAEKARAIIKAKLRGNTLNSGIDPELLQAGITLAAYHVERGARKFAAYARAMVDDLGDVVKPYLQSWYMAMRSDPTYAAMRADMDKASAVEDLDVDEVLAESSATAPVDRPENHPPLSDAERIKKGAEVAERNNNGLDGIAEMWGQMVDPDVVVLRIVRDAASWPEGKRKVEAIIKEGVTGEGENARIKDMRDFTARLGEVFAYASDNLKGALRDAAEQAAKDEFRSGMNAAIDAKLADATATHKDPGEPAEAVTPAVVRDAIQTAAESRDRPIKDVKADALRLVDEAIAKAPSSAEVDAQIGVTGPKTVMGKKVLTGSRGFDSEASVVVEAREAGDGKWTVTDESYDGSGTGRKRKAKLGELQGTPAVAREQLMSLLRRMQPGGTLSAPNMVTIRVPGDGVFTVENTKERLAEFRKKVEASPGFKAQRPGPIESPRINPQTSMVNPGATFGVEDGSGSKVSAFDNMVNEGDLEAASDYADAVGLTLDPAKMANASKVLKWRETRPAPQDEASTTATARAGQLPAADVFAVYRAAESGARGLWSSSGATRHNGRLRKGLGDLGLKPAQVSKLMDEAATVHAQRTRGSSVMSFLSGQDFMAGARRAGIVAEQTEAPAPAPAADAPPAWHTPLPERGEAIASRDRTYPSNPASPLDTRKIVARLATEAMDAITRDQMLNITSGMQMVPWVLPAEGNRNGVVRLLPADQKPGAPWQPVGTDPIAVGGPRDRAIGQLIDRLRSAPILASEDAAPAPAREKREAVKRDRSTILAESEVRKTNANSAMVWQIIHGPTGEAIDGPPGVYPGSGALAGSATMGNRGWGTKREAQAALDELKRRAAPAEAAEPATQPQAEPAAAATPNTEDAGAELTYNRRNRVKTGIKWADIADKNDALKVKEAVKQNVYPRPDYQALVDGGMNPMVAHLVKQVYDAIPPKPATRGAPTDADIQTYITGVNRVMAGVMAWTSDTASVAKWAAREARSAGAALGRITNLSDMVSGGGKSMLDMVWPDGWQANRAEVSVLGSNKILGALQPSYEEGRRASKAVSEGWPAAQEAWEKRGIKIIHADKLDVSYYEGKRIGTNEPYVSLSFKVGGARIMDRIVNGAESQDDPKVKAAVAAELDANQGMFIVMDKMRRILGRQHTEEAAKEVAREVTKREGKTGGPDDSGIDLSVATREGVPRRLPGEDITSDRLKDTYGLKGVNFGNWMKGDTPALRAERQAHLNHAYDSFADLAEVLGIPPKAISLNGMLGLAIGAQGNGKYAAHFVPGVNEINLTRNSGAGSLAHEFGHALDHYFANQAGFAARAEPFLTEHTTSVNRKVIMENGRQKLVESTEDRQIRPEIVERFKAIVKAMNKKPETLEQFEARQKASKETARSSVDRWLKAIKRDYVKAGVDEAAIGALSERILALDLGDGKVSLSSSFYVNKPVDDLRDLYRKKTGRVPPVDQIKGLQSNLDYYAYAMSERPGAIDHTPQQVSTDYANAAAALDSEKKGKRYWSTELEKFARAFDAFVSDQLEAKAAKNTYLSHAGRTGDTVPMGDERADINAAIKALVSEFKTREDDAGNVAMFSRAESGMTRRNLLIGIAAAAATGKASAGTTLGKAKPISEAVLHADLTASAAKILRGNGATNPNGATAILAAMREIAASGPADLRALAAQVASLLPSTGVMLTVDDKRVMNAHGAVSFGMEGPHLQLFTAGGRTGMTYGTFIHEALHLAVLARYKTISTAALRGNDAKLGVAAPAASKQMAKFTALWDEFEAVAKANPPKDFRAKLSISEAVGNPDEFFVRALTDPLLQEYLAGIEYEGKTLLERFKDWVTGLFSKSGVRPSWLDAALLASSEMAAGMPADKADYARLKASNTLSSQREAVFSRAQGQQQPASDRRQAVEALVKQIAARWANAPEVVVVDSLNDPRVPEAVRKDEQTQQSKASAGAPEGFFHGGKVYLVAGQLGGDADVVRVLFHEALGHYGLRGTFGADLATILDRLAVLNAAKVRAKAKQYGLDYDKPSDRRAAAEEVLAEMAQRTPDIGWGKKAIAAVRTWLRTHVPGFRKMALTDAEIVRSYILPARAFVQRGGPGGGGSGVVFSRAYHGTPHRGIKKFSTDYMGTGEGAQVFGWGLYFASQKDVADWYRQKLTPSEVTYKASIFSGSIDLMSGMRPSLSALRKAFPALTNSDAFVDAAYAAIKTISASKSIADALSELRASLQYAGPSGGKYFSDQIAWIEQNKGKLKYRPNKGQLYEVEIPDDEHMLLWDKPLSEQPDAVRKALDGLTSSKSIEDETRKFLRSRGDDVLGHGIYNALMTDDLIGGKKGASLFLRQLGVRGINYPAGTLSGGQVNKEDRNYVVFSGDDVAIERAMFSRASIADAVRDFSQAGARNAFLDAVTTHGGTNLWGRTVGTQYHKAQANPTTFGRVFDAVQDYIKDTSVFANRAADLAPSLLPKLDSWVDLKKGGLLHHGAKPADTAKAGEAIFRGTLDKVLYDEATLRSQFGLNDLQVGLYMEFRRAVDESLNGMAKGEILRLAGDDGRAVRAAVLAAPDAESAAEVLAAHLTELAELTANDDLLGTVDSIGQKVKRVQQLMDEGYAPLMRFGKHTLHVTRPDGGTEFFGMYESVREANNVARLMKADPALAGMGFAQGVMSQEGHKLFNGMSLDALELFADATDNATNPVYQEYLKLALSNRSAMKRMIERKAIKGYSEDVARVLASFVTSNARMSAGHLHLTDAKKAAEAIPKETGDLRDDAINLVEYVTNPAEEAAAVRGLLFTSFIGGSVASALVNLTQPITMTLPYLTQWGGVAAASKRMLAAAGMVASGKGMDADLRAALARAEQDGIVSPQEIHHLQAEAMATVSNKYPVLKKVAFVWGSMFSLAEQFNRRVSFVAAYQTAQQEGIADPFAFAEKAVVETQGLYCVDEETECLTAAGWKRHADLAPGEPVFAIDEATGGLVESRLVDVHRFNGNLKATEFRNSNGFSMVVTDKHDMLIRSHNSRTNTFGKIRRANPSDVKVGHHFLRVPLGDATGRKAVYSDDEVSLFAWVAAEGSMYDHRNCTGKRGIQIVQSSSHNPEYVAEIDALLDRLGGHYSRMERIAEGGPKKMVRWKLRKALAAKARQALPGKLIGFDLIADLTVPQMALFLNTFTKGDGHFPEEGGATITQKIIGNLDALQAMAVLSGQTSTKYDRMGRHDFGALYVAKNSKHAHSRPMRRTEVQLPMVWCPETEHGTWIARRNGRTFVTGNSKANKPNFARGPYGATIMTFKQFSIHYLEFLTRMAKSGPDGRKAVAVALALLLLTAGAGGLPFADDLDDLIDTLGQFMGHDTNSKRWKRQFIAQTLGLGEDAAEVATRGITALPGMPVDLSLRMGLGNLLPATGLFLRSNTDTGRQLMEVAGAAGGLAANVMDGVKKAAGGDVVGGVMNAMPIAVQNMAKAAQMWDTGEYRNKKGQKVMNVDAVDGAMKFIGFQPAAVARESSRIGETMRTVQLAKNVEGEIAGRWAQGMADGDREAVASARQELADWNKDNPQAPIKITMPQVLARLKALKTSRAERMVKQTPKELRPLVAETLK